MNRLSYFLWWIARRFTRHTWHRVTFVYGGYTECSCGFRPDCQKDMERHTPFQALWAKLFKR